MFRRVGAVGGMLLIGSTSFVAAPTSAQAQPPGARAFQERIHPILQRCVVCHSGDTPAGDLNLTTRGEALKGGDSGPALNPGDAAKSLLFSMAASKTMPPKKPLSAAEI